MNNVGKAGAIVSIIGAAILTIVGIIILASGSIFAGFASNSIIIFGMIVLLVGILNIVFSALALTGRKNFIVIAGVFALVSLLIGWLGYVIADVLLLIGGILILCGKKKEEIVTETNTFESKASVVDVLN